MRKFFDPERACDVPTAEDLADIYGEPTRPYREFRGEDFFSDAGGPDWPDGEPDWL